MKKHHKKNEEMVIVELANRYKTILCQLIKSGKNYNQENMLFDPSEGYQKFWSLSSSENLTHEEREICRINFILSSLPHKESEIIFKEFFFPNEKFYWMRKYNRSTYYRLRAKAITNFYNFIK